MGAGVMSESSAVVGFGVLEAAARAVKLKRRGVVKCIFALFVDMGMERSGLFVVWEGGGWTQYYSALGGLCVGGQRRMEDKTQLCPATRPARESWILGLEGCAASLDSGRRGVVNAQSIFVNPNCALGVNGGRSIPPDSPGQL